MIFPNQRYKLRLDLVKYICIYIKSVQISISIIQNVICMIQINSQMQAQNVKYINYIYNVAYYTGYFLALYIQDENNCYQHFRYTATIYMHKLMTFI